MKKIILTIMFMFLLIGNSGYLFSELAGVLSETLKPDNITVHGEKLYVMEGTSATIYSLKDLSVLKTFGKKGEGPGELRLIPQYINKIRVIGDSIITEGATKLIFYSMDGKRLREIKKNSNFIIQAVPIGDRYAVSRSYIEEKGKKMDFGVSLYDSAMKEIKSLHKEPHFQQGFVPPIRFDMVMDYVRFGVAEDKLFIEKSAQGFLIGVYDKTGKELYTIKHPFEKIAITSKMKEAILNRFKNDPLILSQSKNAGGWDNFKKFLNIYYPDTFPAIQNFEISGKKIYVQTFKVEDNRSEYIILDLKGKILKTVFLPYFENTPLLSRIFGAKLHTISNDKLYYLIENEDDEEWELHVSEIK